MRRGPPGPPSTLPRVPRINRDTVRLYNGLELASVFLNKLTLRLYIRLHHLWYEYSLAITLIMMITSSLSINNPFGTNIKSTLGQCDPNLVQLASTVTHRFPSNFNRSDTTLRELVLLLRDAEPSLRNNPLARFSLRLVFFDSERDRFTSKDIGIVTAKDLLTPPSGSSSSAHPSNNRRNDFRVDKTLSEAKFVVGDYVDVAYLSGPAGPPPPFGSGPGGPPLNNGRDSAPHFSIAGRAGPGGRPLPPGRSGGVQGSSRGWDTAGRGGGFSGSQPGRGDPRAHASGSGPSGRERGPMAGSWSRGRGVGANGSAPGRAERQDRWGKPSADRVSGCRDLSDTYQRSTNGINIT